MRKGFLLGCPGVKKTEEIKEDEQKALTPPAAADMLSAATGAMGMAMPKISGTSRAVPYARPATRARAVPTTSAATGAVPKKMSAAKVVGGARRRNIPRSRQHKNFIENHTKLETDTSHKPVNTKVPGILNAKVKRVIKNGQRITTKRRRNQNLDQKTVATKDKFYFIEEKVNKRGEKTVKKGIARHLIVVEIESGKARGIHYSSPLYDNPNGPGLIDNKREVYELASSATITHTGGSNDAELNDFNEDFGDNQTFEDLIKYVMKLAGIVENL